MSHIRNRHNMTSASLVVQRKKPYLNNKTSHLLSKKPPNLMTNSLADMQTASHRPKTSQDNVYNRYYPPHSETSILFERSSIKTTPPNCLSCLLLEPIPKTLNRTFDPIQSQTDDIRGF
jgi:hypothetical protein